ncbi:MAG: tRNA (adenosine(37)-N6)-threonylcarbamoyltransferase complex dimerization subunit type 1 TsaB, partial [Verrucomicrobia bacterium]|nr:tRNA (adenosine(37)-N6)-threonylcarbamoyltransferase complex dimerization subunit type 1 TsaB [Verrucomicrobiota bacterium]
LDTSTEPHFICLSEGKKILAYQYLPHQNNLSASLIPEIENLFKKTSTTLKELSHIFVGVGPGSYTGVRVAVSIATSLSLALDIPAYPFCSLLAFIPDHLPDGPFTFFSLSNHSLGFFLQGSLKNHEISPLVNHELIEEKDFSFKFASSPNLITLSSEDITKNWNLFPSKGILNLPLLLPYLTNLTSSPPLPLSIYYLHQL